MCACVRTCVCVRARNIVLGLEVKGHADRKDCKVTKDEGKSGHQRSKPRCEPHRVASGGRVCTAMAARDRDRSRPLGCCALHCVHLNTPAGGAVHYSLFINIH